MYGATLLYNYLLCVYRKADGATDADLHMARYVTLLSRWAPTLKPAQCDLVATGVLKVAGIAPRLRHGVDPSMIAFVTSWAKFARTPANIFTDKDAHQLVKAREISLKVSLGTSRFANKAARARWKYESGGRLDYRWPIARTYLNDIAPRTDAGA
jgi:post-segregation antitoxin (ccd killing protein)